MRILGYIFLALLGLGLSLWAAGTVFKEDLYAAAMDFEREKAGLEEKRLLVGNQEIRYLENRSEEARETLLLLHGFAASKENWLRLAAELSSQYHLLIPDLPGHGASSKSLEGDYRLQTQADTLSAFLQQTVPGKQVHVAGNSMGGAIVSILAAHFPDQVASVILVNPAGVDDHPAELKEWLERGENPLIVDSLGSFYELVDFAMTQPPFIPWPVSAVAAERSMANQPVNEHIFQQIRSADRQDFKGLLARIQAPVLVLWGKDDRIINYLNADVFVAELANAEKVILPDVGHAPMIEVPSATAELIRDFTAGKPLRAAGASL